LIGDRGEHRPLKRTYSMTRSPIVSVITPSFRSSRWLKLCIASVADQQIDHEHIIQDACSDDGTQDWLPQDIRVKAFIEKDSGMYDAINRGLQKASGEVLAYLNCDEQYLPGALSQVVQFFDDHPDVEVVFAYTVAVNELGQYRFHRKVQVPLLYHTWTHPLSVLTCATFFRRSIVHRRNILFNSAYRIIGDAEWVLHLLREKVAMAVLPQFTSSFAVTGQNLSGRPETQSENRRLLRTAPAWARAVRPAILIHHRLRRWLGGIYRQGPFSYLIYTHDSPDNRVTFTVPSPTSRWTWQPA
jgi:glycosyltransferase involved in cell wall biosynthesis